MEQPQTATSTTTADSSPAPVSPQSYLDRMDKAERDAYEFSGDLPERLTKPSTASTDATAAPSADKPVEQAPGEKAASPADKGPKEKGAKARNVELEAEITGLQDRLKLRKALREELAAIDSNKDAKPDSSSVKPTQTERERYQAMPDAPKLDDYANIEDYNFEVGLFVANKKLGERDAAQRSSADQQQRVQAFEQVTKAATERIEKATAADPEFRSKVDARLLDIAPASALPEGTKPTPANVLVDEVLRSDVTDKLLLHFSTEQGQQDWQGLCRATSHSEFLRAFGRLEADLSRAASAAPAPKHVSSAPDPAHVLGSHAANAGDAETAAIKAKDFARFEREANARELASLG